MVSSFSIKFILILISSVVVTPLVDVVDFVLVIVVFKFLFIVIFWCGCSGGVVDIVVIVVVMVSLYILINIKHKCKSLLSSSGVVARVVLLTSLLVESCSGKLHCC